MSVATSTAIGLGVAGAAGIGSAVIGAHASGKAADAQAQAAEQAAELQHQDAQAALQFQEQEFAQQQANAAPWLQSGASGIANLDYLLGISPSTFNATAVPGFTGNGTQSPPPPWDPSATGFSATGPSSRLTVPDGQGAAQPQGVPLSDIGGASRFNPAGLGNDIPSAGGRGGPPVFSLGGNQFNAQSAIASSPNPQANNPQGGGLALNSQFPAGTPPVGQGGVPISSLVNPNLGRFGSLMQQWGGQFQAPTIQQAEEQPGYQFALQEGERALQNSAAARGVLLTGGTGMALNNYAQNAAQTDYQNVFNNSLTQYQQAYNQFQQAQANQFNRLAAISGVGQVAAGQLSSAGANAAGNVGNILLGSGQQIGNALQNAGSARASGYVGAANSIGAGLGSISSLASILPFLNSNQYNPNAGQPPAGGGGIP